MKIGLVLSKVGRTEESKIYLADFLNFAENDKSIYKHYHLAMYYSIMNDTQKAIEHMKLFSREENIQFWFILFTNIDPVTDPVRDLPEFRKTFREIEKKFWKSHEDTKDLLNAQDLL